MQKNHHQKIMHQQPTISYNYLPNIEQLNLQSYCQYIKQYRSTIKPPITNQQFKDNFCKLFDQVLLKRSLEQIGKFINIRKQMKQRMQSVKDQCGQNKQIKIQSFSLTKQSTSKATQLDTYSTIIDKIILYTWQIINIRTIVSTHQLSAYSIIPQQILHNIHRFCISTSRIYVSKWGLTHTTIKNMQIAYFNLLKNKLFDVDPTINKSLPCLIQAILGDKGDDVDLQVEFINLDKQFKSKHLPNLQKPQQYIKKQKKTKTKLKNLSHSLHKKISTQLQLEWFTYIIQYCIGHYQNFIKSTYLQLSNGNNHIVTHSAISFLHYISLLLNKIINDRITTQIVKGYHCMIQDVKKMYNNIKQNNSPGDSIKISILDYQWFLGILLTDIFEKYKQQLKRLWEKKVYGIQSLHEYDHSYVYCIMNILAITNCCVFLAGYSIIIQKITTKLVLPTILQFLQISYLIYELCHAKKKNIQLKQPSKIKTNFIQNLQNLLNINPVHKINKTDNKQQNFTNNLEWEQKNQLQLSKLLPLEQGQLVSIIRLLSNLVHINEQAQKYFEDNIKYFRIVMSLTHEFQTQLTMKNWVIVFLKNVAERSAVMRQQLQKLQIDVKVDNGASPLI